MFELLNKAPQINDKPDAKLLIINDGAIEFDAINFSYSNQLPILKEFSVKLSTEKLLWWTLVEKG